jgi:ubiquinone biosynthesis protein
MTCGPSRWPPCGQTCTPARGSHGEGSDGDEHVARLEAGLSRGRRVGAADLARGLADNLRAELDYRTGAANTSTIASLLARNGRLRVPAVHDSLTSRRVIVLEWLDGTPLRMAAGQIAAQGLDPEPLARSLLASFLTQVLRAGIFNAHPHPGNVLVMADGTLAQIDFGSVGRLHSGQQLALACLLTAVDRADPELRRDALLELATTDGRIDLEVLDRALAQFLVRRLGPGAAPRRRPARPAHRSRAPVRATARRRLPRAGDARGHAARARERHRAPHVRATRARSRARRRADQARADPAAAAAPARPHQRRPRAPTMERQRPTARRPARRRAGQATHGRCLLACFSAAIGLVSAPLLAADSGVAVAHELAFAQALGYAGLAVATVLGTRVLVAISRQRNI